MKAKLTALLGGLLILGGCHRAAPPGPGSVEVVFSVLGETTRATGTDGEAAVDSWTLLLYRDGRLAEAGASSSGSEIRKTLPAGDYTAYAVVNPPASFDPAGFPAPDALAGAESALGDNAPGRLVMAGRRSVTVPVPDGSVQRIGVDRLVCKAGIRKVSVQFENPDLAARPFRLRGIYLTNCYGKSRYGSDWTADDILSTTSVWHNRMGFHSETGVDGLLAETGLDIPVTADRPHTQEHVFYFYPNPLPASADTRSGTWSRRKTRLVLEAQIGERTYYYPVTLPESQRNRTYLIEEAVIRKLGSLDPEKDEPGAIDVTFSTSPDDWSPAYNVTETS
jgi:hypothetical protein